MRKWGGSTWNSFFQKNKKSLYVQILLIHWKLTRVRSALNSKVKAGKTTAGCFRYARYILETRDENHLIVGFNQEQAYRLFIEGDGYGLKNIFGKYATLKHNEQGDHLEVLTPNGIRRIFYKGGSKSNSVGAITGFSLGSIVFLEINLLNMSMIQECFRRTFAAKDRYHLSDLNPPHPQHPVIKEVFDVQNTKWRHWTIHDNPIITEERKTEIYNILKKNPYLLDRDWFGKRVTQQGVIYDMFNMEEHVLPALVGKPYEMFFVADGGQSDATSCSCNIVVRHDDKMKLIRVANYYHSGKDTGQTKAMSTYAREIQEFIRWCTNKYQMNYQELFVDPACKSLREEFHMLGLTTRGAMNNAHDVQGASKGLEVGIERMQNSISNGQFYLLETDKYDHYNFLTEIGMYVRINNGKPIDNYNHALDECRYANNYFYSRYVL